MANVNIKPLGDRIVIEPVEAEEKTAGGIIIPDTAKEKPSMGIVVAVPDASDENKITVEVGNKVLYGKYAGTEITLNDNDYLIMSESDILAIV